MIDRFTLTLLLLLTRLAHGYVTTESSDFPSVSVEPGLELGSEVLEQHRAGSTTGRRPGRECSCSPLPMPERVRTEVKEMECRCLGDAFVDIPDNISTFMCRLTVSDAGIKLLRSTALQPYRETLRDLTLANIWQLREIQPGTFENMLQLRTIYIYKAPLLVSVATSVFNVALPRLKILRIVHTGLVEVPAFAGLQTDNILNMVDLENNQIHHITSGSISVKAEQLLLNYNLIERVEAYAFNGSQLAKLSLKGNRALTHLHRDAFVGLQSLQHLDLSRTSITALPTNGLQELEVLRLQDTTTVKVFPSIYRFEAIREAWLTYPYHCCAFHYPATHDLVEYNKHQEFLQKMSHHCSRRRRSAQGPWGPMGLETLNETKSSWGPLGGDPDPKPFDTESDGTFHQEGILLSPGTVHAMCGNLSKNYHDVRCFPAPDAFNPCEDLMGNWALRTAVWIVAVAALVGNLAVLLVLLSSRFRMTVPKFLMVNLALADLCMGLYLLMIAAMDAQSIGDYFNHAIYWQSGLGCKVAGFLTVFASELSIFTLAIITSERWYTITYAMHLNKRLRLSSAVKIMTLGWAYAITMATLPLVGVSGYSKTSICLPMENNEFVDLVYLFLLLTLNGLAFFLICACYGRMYCSIRRGQDMLVAQTRSDMTVAKRMALLVFTDFACWAPIAFFGLTALAGYPLIDVPHTKILLVFFYPLNSCANPYLYALLTQQYRRDTFVLLSRYGVCTRRAMAYKIGGIGHIPRLSQPTPVDKSKTPNHRGSLQTTFTSVDNTKAITLSTNPIVIRRPLSPSPCGLGDGCLGPQSSVL